MIWSPTEMLAVARARMEVSPAFAAAARAVAVGLHAHQGGLVGRLLAGIAEGVVEHAREPVAESSQTLAGPGKSYRLGDQITVKVVHVEPMRGQLDLEVVRRK